MPEELLTLLTQAPMVGIFMIYMWFNGKENRAHQQSRDDAFHQSLDKIAGKFENALYENTVQLNTNTTVLVHHDATVRGVNDNTQGDLAEMKRMIKQSLPKARISAES